MPFMEVTIMSQDLFWHLQEWYLLIQIDFKFLLKVKAVMLWSQIMELMLIILDVIWLLNYIHLNNYYFYTDCNYEQLFNFY